MAECEHECKVGNGVLMADKDFADISHFCHNCIKCGMIVERGSKIIEGKNYRVWVPAVNC